MRRSFDACPIYSASQRTDLRSSNESSRTKGLTSDAPQACAARLRPSSSPRSPPRRSPPPPPPALLTKSARVVRRRCASRSRSSASATARTTSSSPGGSFESGADRLAAQRRRRGRLAATRPTRSAAPRHSRSLSLPAGSRAISPFTCVGLAEPTLRLFAKRNSALLGLVSTLNVEIQVQTSLGLSALAPGAAGRPRRQLVAPDRCRCRCWPTSCRCRASDRTPVRFRFTAAARLLADRRRVRRSVHAPLAAGTLRRRGRPGSAPAGPRTLSAMVSEGADRGSAQAVLEALFAGAPVGLGLLGRGPPLPPVNPRLAEINGLPAEDHIGRTPSELLGAGRRAGRGRLPPRAGDRQRDRRDGVHGRDAGRARDHAPLARELLPRPGRRRHGDRRRRRGDRRHRPPPRRRARARRAARGRDRARPLGRARARGHGADLVDARRPRARGAGPRRRPDAGRLLRRPPGALRRRARADRRRPRGLRERDRSPARSASARPPTPRRRSAPRR